MKNEISMLKRGSKQWWSLLKRLMSKAGESAEIPSLKKNNGSWIRTANEKANLFADTFTSKWILPDALTKNSSTQSSSIDVANTFIPIRLGKAKYFLASLDASSGTGSDLLASRLLKELADCLALPFAKLARLIIRFGRWPFCWRIHWVLPLYKKKSVYNSGNYRDI